MPYCQDFKETRVTHLSTLEAAVRHTANRCDLGGFNAQFFLKAGFIQAIALLIQHYEQEAYNKGLAERTLASGTATGL